MGYRFTSFWFVNIAFGIAFPLYLQVPSVIHVPWNRNLSLKTISIFVSFIIDPVHFLSKDSTPPPRCFFFFFFCSHLFGPLRAVRIPISLSLSHHYTTTPIRNNSEKFKMETIRKIKITQFPDGLRHKYIHKQTVFLNWYINNR